MCTLEDIRAVQTEKTQEKINPNDDLSKQQEENKNQSNGYIKVTNEKRITKRRTLRGLPELTIRSLMLSLMICTLFCYE